MSKLCVLVDYPRHGAKQAGRILFGYEWEMVNSKCLRAGLLPQDIEVVSISPQSRYPDEADKSRCISYLNDQDFSVILALDETALQLTTGKRNIWKWHLSPLQAVPELKCRKVVPSFHPDQIRKDFVLNLYLEFSVKKAAKHLTPGEWQYKPRRFLLNPCFDHTVSVLESIRGEEWLSIDIETGRNQINTFGVAWSVSDAIAVKVLPDDLPPAHHYKLWELIRDLCESPAKKIMQNGIYERSYFSRYGVHVNNFAHDTMCAMKVLWPELEKGLDNVGRLHTMEPYWKDVGKVASEEGKQKDWGDIRDWDQHLLYNCLSKNIRVETDKGLLPIGQIVQKRLKLNVKSYNKKLKAFEWKPITNWFCNQSKTRIEWVKIQTEALAGKRGLTVTPDHKILTERGWIEAQYVRRGDYMLVEGLRHNMGSLGGTILGDSWLAGTSDKTSAYVGCVQVNRELIELKQKLFGGTLTASMRRSGYATDKREMFNLYIPASHQLGRLLNRSKMLLVDGLTSMGIALWVMDDGCQQRGRYPYMKLALQRYTSAERAHIKEFFAHRYQTKIGLDKAGNLRFNREGSKQLCAEIGPYVVPSMRYKLSHSAPDFSEIACLAFRSCVLPMNIQVTDVSREVRKERGYRNSFCIEVADNHNFMTEYGIVANCLDSANTMEGAFSQREALRQRGLMEFYDGYVRRLFDPTYEMAARGLPLNPVKREALVSEYEARSAELIAQMSEPVNPRSSKQKIELFAKKGIKLPNKRNKKTGKLAPSADELSLKKARLKHPDDKDIRLLLEIAGIEKALSSYLRVKTFPDNRIRFSLDPFSTETGRMACKKDAWDMGFNAQTMTDYVKSMIEFPESENRVFVEIDLSQAESRFVAYDSCEETLIGMLERREDIHRYVAAEIYCKPMSEVVYDERQLGKKAGHGANYDMGVATFQDTCLKEMNLVLDRKTTTRVLEAYHRLFPGIRRGHAQTRETLYRERKLKNPLGFERYFYGRLDDNTFREAYAFKPQSTIPAITNYMMFGLDEERKAGRTDFWLHSQCHDSIYLSCKPDHVERICEYAARTEKWHPEIILPAGKLVIPTEAKFGRCLGTMEKWGN
mgnify:CR=1 FL=1